MIGWLRRKKHPYVSVDFADGTVYVRVPRVKGSSDRPAAGTVELAQEARRVVHDEDHPENEGKILPSYSNVMVLADYDADDRLYAIEIIGVPTTRPEPETLARSNFLDIAEVLERVDEALGLYGAAFTGTDVSMELTAREFLAQRRGKFDMARLKLRWIRDRLAETTGPRA